MSGIKIGIKFHPQVMLYESLVLLITNFVCVLIMMVISISLCLCGVAVVTACIWGAVIAAVLGVASLVYFLWLKPRKERAIVSVEIEDKEE